MGVTEVRTVLADDVVMGTLDVDNELEVGVMKVVELDRTTNGIWKNYHFSFSSNPSFMMLYYSF